MKFIITIDTEGDNQWDAGLPRSTDNIRFIPRFQELCERYDFPPTYLCTYEVATAPAFETILLPLHEHRRAEIGAHLHPWTNPPFSQWDRSDTTAAYPSELPLGVFAVKLDSLTDALAGKLGARPRSYRAGRWGLSAAHVPVLLQAGYIVDCSVTPLVSWVDPGARERGQDFSEAPVKPYFIAWGDPSREGASGLLEVPVTIVHTNRWMRASPLLRAAYRRHRKAAAARLFNRAFWIAPQWLRPFSDMTVNRLKAVYETARGLELPVIEMMFHSSELMPGGSPHNTTAEAVEILYQRLEQIFAFLVSERVEGSTLSEFAEATRLQHAARRPMREFAVDELTWAPARDLVRRDG